MGLDLNTILIFAAIAYLASFISLLVLSTHFESSFKWINRFLIFYLFSFGGILFYQINGQSGIILMLSTLFLIAARVSYLEGFLKFYDRKLKIKYYIAIVLFLTIIIHTMYFIKLDDIYTLLILVVLDIILYISIICISLIEKNKFMKRYNYVTFINILFLVNEILYLFFTLFCMIFYNNFDRHLENVTIGINAIISMLLLSSIMYLIIGSNFDTLEKVERRLNEAQKLSKSGSWEIDINTKKVWASEEAFRIYELEKTKDGLLDLNTVQNVVHKDDRQKNDEALYNLITSNVPYDIRFRIVTLNKNLKYIQSKAFLIFDKNNKPIKVLGTFRDITDIHKKEEELRFTSYHDHLTRLYNRRYIEQKLIELDKLEYLPLSIMIGDLNGLKLANDTFGHDFGDSLLITASNIFKDIIKDRGIIGRQGGDEFIVLFPKTSLEQAEDYKHQVLREIYKYNEFNNSNFSISLGVCCKTTDELNLSQTIKRAEDKMYRDKVNRSPSVRRKAVDAIIQTLFEKDPLTEKHSQNVAKYSVQLAKAAGLSDTEINTIETAALLHDIGKIVIEDSILKSNKKLTDPEYELIKQHPKTGYRILNTVDEFNWVANVILFHHERVDGKGYPFGVNGYKIPIEAKIIAICDAYDAMIGERLYRQPLSREQVINEFINGKGTQFEPELVDIFIETILA